MIEFVDEFKPDHKSNCETRDQSPVVTIRNNGKLIEYTGLCGACYFGSAECLDPEEW